MFPRTAVVTLTFPTVHRTETHVLPLPGGRNQGWAVPDTGPLADIPARREHIIEFKGNTVVEMSPDIFPGSPVFRRGYLRTNEAPMKTVTRYVSPQRLTW